MKAILFAGVMALAATTAQADGQRCRSWWNYGVLYTECEATPYNGYEWQQEQYRRHERELEQEQDPQPRFIPNPYYSNEYPTERQKQ